MITIITTVLHFAIYGIIVTASIIFFAALNIEFIKEAWKGSRMPGRIRLIKVRAASKGFQRRAILTSSRSNTRVLCAGISSILTEP